jgi:hypothetical protein
LIFNLTGYALQLRGGVDFEHHPGAQQCGGGSQAGEDFPDISSRAPVSGHFRGPGAACGSHLPGKLGSDEFVHRVSVLSMVLFNAHDIPPWRA